MKNTTSKKTIGRIRRHARIRAKVFGTAERPRLAVYRSNRFITAQLINDDKGVTLVSADDLKITKGTKIEHAKKVGALLAEAARAKKITTAVFDRGGFLYAGRVKALADGAREGGLQF